MHRQTLVAQISPGWTLQREAKSTPRHPPDCYGRRDNTQADKEPTIAEKGATMFQASKHDQPYIYMNGPSNKQTQIIYVMCDESYTLNSEPVDISILIKWLFWRDPQRTLHTRRSLL